MYRESARAREDQSGAVAQRASSVAAEYARHARRLDTAYSAVGTTPIQDRLRSFSQVRALVFGQFGEASADVHHLLAEAATRMARSEWRRWGARSMAEARAFFIASLRRQLGVCVVREFARHRCTRPSSLRRPSPPIDCARARPVACEPASIRLARLRGSRGKSGREAAAYCGEVGDAGYYWG